MLTPRRTPRPPTSRAARKRRERGQSLVEFALVLPIFLIIILAAVDFGWALRSYVTITNSAREGARIGVVGASSGEIVEKTVKSSAGLLSASNVKVTNARGKSGESIVVTVNYNYTYITPLGSLLAAFTGGSLPSPLPMNSSTTMRLE